jgi:hypothetical protein
MLMKVISVVLCRKCTNTNLYYVIIYRVWDFLVVQGLLSILVKLKKGEREEEE